MASNPTSPSSPTRPLLLLASGIVGGGLLAAFVLEIGSSQTPSSAAPAPELVAAIERMSEQVQQLGDQHNDFMRRMNDLELAMLAEPGISSPTIQALTPEGSLTPLEELRADVAQLTDAVQSASPSDEMNSAPLVNQVVEALGVIEEKREADREAERAVARQERLDKTIEDLTETLGLDSNQQYRMRETLEAAAAARPDRDSFTGSRDEMRAARDEAREDVNTKIASFLSPSQVQTLEDNGGLQLGGNRFDRGRGGR
jgi:hypothetical protein